MPQTDTAAISDTYDLSAVKVVSFTESFQSVATGASYADAIVLDARAIKSGLIITLLETVGAQSFFYKILASIKDGATAPVNTDSSYISLISDVSVAANGKDYQILAAPWKWIIVQVKNNSGSATAMVRARGIG